MACDAGHLVGGGTVPFRLTYAPTGNASVVEIDVEGTVVINFTGCTGCPYTAPLTLAAGSQFTAPLDSGPGVAPGASSAVTLHAGPLPFALGRLAQMTAGR
jgi:hypothetical protein